MSMRKMVWLIFSVAITSVMLLGCQSDEDSFALKNENVSSVSVSESTGFGEVNPDFFMTYEEGDVLETFKQIISSAVQEPGIVDISLSGYDMQYMYEDGTTQGYHLWINEAGEKSIIMNVENSNITYTVSEEMTSQLRELMKTEEHTALVDEKISQVNIKGLIESHSDFFISYDQTEVLEAFQNIFSNAVKEPGIVNIADPEFYLEIIFADETKQKFYLWLGEEGEISTLMNVEDTHTIYTVPAEMTSQLREWIK
ncbi:hypothetical protein [Longirhabdus pacifica]|uniref:hypothetical protein n=1 Tax=Longirhabdus pacifica TaxID=2305227 RepID=UPI001008F105|nr:hypothetical protein [Longirhabdus pacifica]